MNFTVIDTKTGEYPDLWDIALHEEWAQDLMYCDIEGFATLEDGTLILMDECGRFAYCPEGRFQIVPDEPNEPLTLEAVAREYLEICGNNCSGDASVGIPSCPFFEAPDIGENGVQIVGGCKLATYRRPPERQEDKR